jgi:hypothetical protein
MVADSEQFSLKMRATRGGVVLMIRSCFGAIALAFCWQVLLQAQFSTVTNVPPTVIGDDQTIGSDTQLNVFAGGEVGTNFRAGAEDYSSTNVQVNVVGGTIDSGFIFYGSEVNLLDGNIQGNPSARRSVVNMSGGTIDNTLSLFFESVANISGGSILQIQSGYGSTTNISGGNVRYLWPHRGETNITGGYVGWIRRLPGTTTSNESSIINLSDGVVAGIDLAGNNILNITGGTITGNCYLGNSQSFAFAQANISGGTFESSFYNGTRSIANIIGGTFESSLILAGEANISGGSLAGPFYVSGSLQFVGRQFLLDGIDITNTLTPGIPLTVTQRNVTLSGLLADGSPFDFNLNESPGVGVDYIVPTATLTIALAAVPEPSGVVMLFVAAFLGQIALGRSGSA